MTKFWQNNKKLIITVALMLIGGGSGTFIVGPEYFVHLIKGPLYFEELVEMERQYHHDKEMWWEWGRTITDNWDSTVVYRVVDDWGNAYEVDVRWVNGPNNSPIQIPVAFVYRPMYRPYPIYTSVNGRWYINFHDNKSGETQNCYLYIKD